MSRAKIAYLLFLVLFLNACSMFQPYVDRRREAGVRDQAHLYVGESKPEAPAICYNSWHTPYSEVKKLAIEECEKHGTGKDVKPVKQTSFTCSVLIPNHIYFKCIK